MRENNISQHNKMAKFINKVVDLKNECKSNKN